MNEIKLRQQSWNLLVVLAIIYSSFEAPLVFVFKLIHVSVPMATLDLALSLIFTIDFFFYVKEKKINLRTIKNLKLYDWSILLIYFLCCVPFDFLSLHFEWASTFQILRILRVLRLFRISKLFAIVGELTVIPLWFKITASLIGSAIVINMISSGWIWLYPKPEDKTLFEYYIHALYWAITTLTTIGYGDITPSTVPGRIYTMVIMIIGAGVYGVIIGKISQTLSDANRHKEKSKEKIQDLTSFLQHYEIPKNVQLETLSYYANFLNKRLSDNDHQIIADLPSAIQEELKLYMDIKLIGSLKVFQGCSRECLKEIATHLEKKSYSPGQNIITLGEIGHEMYIINHGSVNVLNSANEPIAKLVEGTFFGEKALLQEMPRNASVVASSYCDLYKLEKSEFLRIIKIYPELLKNMEYALHLKKS